MGSFHESCACAHQGRAIPTGCAYRCAAAVVRPAVVFGTALVEVGVAERLGPGVDAAGVTTRLSHGYACATGGIGLAGWPAEAFVHGVADTPGRGRTGDWGRTLVVS